MKRMPGDPVEAEMPAAPVTRREFVERMLKVAGIGAVASGIAWSFHDRVPAVQAKARLLRDHRVDSPGPKMALATGAKPAANVRAVLAALGRIERFVKRGEVVLVKPNVGWDRIPAQAADTDPEVVAEIVRQCVAAGAREVVVADIPCNDARRSFSRSGIEEAAAKAGAKVLVGPGDMVSIDLGGKILGEWEVFAPLIGADRVINVPVVKHHGLAKATVGMKNWFGVLGKRRFLLHQRIDDAIVELALAVKPTLTVVDATRILMRNGPTGGALADVKSTMTLAAGTDPVALDSWGVELLGLHRDEVPYLALAQARGLGTSDWKSLAPSEANPS